MKNAPKQPIHMSHPKPIVPRRLVIVFSVCLIAVLLYAALITIMHQKGLYAHIADPVAQEENTRILSYLNGPLFGANDLDFLTAAERSHMTDVKRLFDIAFILYIFGLGIIIGTITVFAAQKLWLRFDEMLARSLRAVGWTLIGLCALGGAAALLDFTRFWALFHALLFPQGNWAFPYDSVLITLYPPSFFASFALRVFLYLFATSIGFIVLSTVMIRMRVVDHQFNESWERKNAGKQEERAAEKTDEAASTHKIPEKGGSPTRKHSGKGR
jgi:integral membrane protein (TIGR01906 family)